LEAKNLPMPRLMAFKKRKGLEPTPTTFGPLISISIFLILKEL
jgi:hypothetical protein